MKGSCFGSPQQQVDMQGQKTVLYAFILFKDSQTIHFSKPLEALRDAMGERAALCTAFPGGTTIFTTPKVAPSGKEWICVFIHTNPKRPTSGRAIC